MTTKKTLPKFAPSYMVGDQIASNLFAGKIKSMFFDENEWRYNIGENASVNRKSTILDGYHNGPKFIRESDIKWWLNDNIEWVTPEGKKQ